MLLVHKGHNKRINSDKKPHIISMNAGRMNKLSVLDIQIVYFDLRRDLIMKVLILYNELVKRKCETHVS